MLGKLSVNERRDFGSLVVCALIVSLFLSFSAISNFLYHSIGAPLSFKIRNLVGMDPPLDPRLKILGYGDKTFEEFGDQEILSLDLWADLLLSLDKSRPKVIIIDKMFTLKNHTQSNIDHFLKRVAKINTPIVSAVSQYPQRRIFSKPVPVSKLKYREQTSDDTEVLDVSLLYGPIDSLHHFFSDYGHINISDNSLIQPYFSYSNNAWLPSLGLNAAGQFSWQNQLLQVDGKTIYPNRQGLAQPNFHPRSSYYQLAAELGPIFKWSKSGEANPDIKEQDIVLIIPAFHTGNTDLKPSPVGIIEGGFIHAALIQSVLSGRWLSFVGSEFLFSWMITFAFCVPLFLININHSSRKNIRLRGIVILGILVLGMGAFCVFDMIIPWYQSVICAVVTSAFATAKGAIRLDRYAVQVTQAMEGLVSPQLLGRLKRNPNLLKVKECEVEITVMFIDVESFSLRAQKYSPGVVFRDLRKGVERICTLVHKNGGIVDKTLGDGILCFFGFSLDASLNKDALKNHATAAIRTAIDIQREFADSINGFCRENREGLILPLRIGINTGQAFFGNLGAGLRVDFTIVGEAVNFAKRLEDVCEPFRVMMGPTTKKQMEMEIRQFQEILPANVRFSEKLFHMKHIEELMLGYECEPLVGEFQDIYDTALFNIRIQDVRKSKRYAVSREKPLKIRLSEGSKAKLLNYSLDGLAIETDVYLARKVRLSLWFEEITDDMMKSLSAHMLLPISVEVRWSTRKDDRIFLGLSLLNTSNERKNFLINMIMEYFGQNQETLAG